MPTLAIVSDLAAKKCFKCREVKSLADFYKHSGMADGYLNKCRECTKRDATRHRLANLEKIRRYDRERAKLPHRIQSKTKATAEWRLKNPRRYQAHTALNNAVRAGKIQKSATCAVCGERHKRIEAHHFDYSKPLDVVWCCPVCHWKLDEERREHELWPISKSAPA